MKRVRFMNNTLLLRVWRILISMPAVLWLELTRLDQSTF